MSGAESGEPPPGAGAEAPTSRLAELLIANDAPERSVPGAAQAEADESPGTPESPDAEVQDSDRDDRSEPSEAEAPPEESDGQSERLAPSDVEAKTDVEGCAESGWQPSDVESPLLEFDASSETHARVETSEPPDVRIPPEATAPLDVVASERQADAPVAAELESTLRTEEPTPDPQAPSIEIAGASSESRAQPTAEPPSRDRDAAQPADSGGSAARCRAAISPRRGKRSRRGRARAR